jgi:hypothetical protein
MWNVPAHKFVRVFRVSAFHNTIYWFFLLTLIKVGYILEVFYGPVIVLAKLAILILLKRIFSIKKRFVISVQILVAILSTYYIAITLVKIFICKPVEKFWNRNVPGSCLNTNVIFVSDCMVSLITDFIILVAPLPVIWGLQMDLKRKLGSSLALVVGAMYVKPPNILNIFVEHINSCRACVASILRLEASIRTMDDPDKSYIFEPILLYR